jgi:hypothetical protein
MGTSPIPSSTNHSINDTVHRRRRPTTCCAHSCGVDLHAQTKAPESVEPSAIFQRLTILCPKAVRRSFLAGKRSLARAMAPGDTFLRNQRCTHRPVAVFHPLAHKEFISGAGRSRVVVFIVTPPAPPSSIAATRTTAPRFQSGAHDAPDIAILQHQRALKPTRCGARRRRSAGAVVIPSHWGA